MDDDTRLVVNSNLEDNVDVEHDQSRRDEPEDLVEILRDLHQTSSDENGQIGFASVLFLTVNATLGAGMLNIPYEFNHHGGIISTSVFQFLHMCIVIISLLVLSLAAEISKSDSFKNVVHHFCGSPWGSLNQVAVILYSFGSCVTYIIITGDQFDKFFVTFYGPSYSEHFYMTRGFLMTLLSVVAILPLCYSKDISFLKFASFIGFCSTIYICLLVQWKWFTMEPRYQHSEKIMVKANPLGGEWYQALLVASVLTFSYQCQLSWVPTHMQIRNRTSFVRIFAMASASMLVCFLSYTWVAVFGILTFGSGLERDIMLNYDPREILVAVGMGLLIIKSVVVYPLLLFVGRKVMEDWASSFYNADYDQVDESRWKKSKLVRYSAATMWLATSCLLAVFVPNIGVAIHYLGLLANLFVFLLPGVCLFTIALNDCDVERAQMIVQCACLNRASLVCISILMIGYGMFGLYLSVLQTLDIQLN